MEPTDEDVISFKHEGFGCGRGFGAAAVALSRLRVYGTTVTPSLRVRLPYSWLNRSVV
jgi:hypothetical protein